MGLIEYKFTLSQYINQILLVTYVMFLLIVSLSAETQKIHRSKPTSTMCYGVFICYLCDSESVFTRQTLNTSSITLFNKTCSWHSNHKDFGVMLLWWHRPDRPVLGTYTSINAHLGRGGPSSLAAPSLLSPHSPLVPDCSWRKARRWKMGRGILSNIFF